VVVRQVPEIEAESYRRLRAEVDLGAFPPLCRAVVERVVHATGDASWAQDLLVDEDALVRGLRALRAGCPLVVDVEMVAAGIPGAVTACGLRHPVAAERATARGTTRSAEGLRLAAAEAGPGAVYAIGTAPTALEALLSLAGDLRPALIIGLPVGWVGAVEAKTALRRSGLPAVTNHSRKGGAAAAAAAVNALRYAEGP